MENSASAVTGALTPAEALASAFVSEIALNNHQSFRAEIITRHGKMIVSLSRWKKTPAGARRTGQTFEFGAHRSAGIAKLLLDVQDRLKATGADRGGERHE